MRDRTTFLISHRLNVFKNCDLVLAIGNGRVVQTDGFLAAARSAAAFGGYGLLHREQNR